MKTALPALIAALSVALAPVPSLADRGGQPRGNGARSADAACPPGLSRRDPACVPPGQAGRGQDDRDAREQAQAERDRDRAGRREAERALAEEIAREREQAERDRAGRRERDRDDDGTAALAIVGGLLGLALIERAQRDRTDDPEPEAAPAAPPPAPWVPPEIPSRPAYFAYLPDALEVARAEREVAAIPTLRKPAPAPVGPIIPPPPPMASDVTTDAPLPLGDDLATAFRRAQESGRTGF